MMICEHNKFRVQAVINRLTDKDGGPVTSYHGDFQVWCDECEEPFHFVGVPFGISLVGGAMSSVDGLVLNCRLSPGALEITMDGKAKYTL